MTRPPIPTVAPKCSFCNVESEFFGIGYMIDAFGHHHLAEFRCPECGRESDGVEWQDESRTWSYQDINWQYRIDCKPVPLEAA